MTTTSTTTLRTTKSTTAYVTCTATATNTTRSALSAAHDTSVTAVSLIQVQDELTDVELLAVAQPMTLSYSCFSPILTFYLTTVARCHVGVPRQ